MSNWYYYNEKGEKTGPISGVALRALAEQRLITPETVIENENGKSAIAGKVKGLVFPETKTPPEPETASIDEIEPASILPTEKPEGQDEANPFTVEVSDEGNPFAEQMLVDTFTPSTPEVKSKTSMVGIAENVAFPSNKTDLSKGNKNVFIIVGIVILLCGLIAVGRYRHWRHEEYRRARESLEQFSREQKREQERFLQEILRDYNP